MKALSPFQKHECPGYTRDLTGFVQSVEGTGKQMQEGQDKGRELSRYSCFFWIFCCCESELISLTSKSLVTRRTMGQVSSPVAP